MTNNQRSVELTKIQIGKRTTPKRRIDIRRRRKLPAKVGMTKTIKNMDGQVIFVGTENEWRRWVKERDADCY
jgi:hypothetical protein